MKRHRSSGLLASLAVVLVLAGVAGCSGSRGSSAELPDEETRLAAARAAVSQFFGHVGARDCAALVPMFLDGATDEQCRRFLDDVEHRQLEFRDIDDAYIDGRNPRAVVVRARMSSRRGEKDKLVRVELVAGAWKIRL